MTVRAFVAVELPDDLRRQIARLQQDLRDQLARAAIGHARVSWPRPESMHLTLKFLGDIDDGLVGPLGDAMAAATASSQPIDVPFGRIGAFPRAQDPRTVWIGPPAAWDGSAEARRLADLARTIDHGCERLGVPRERKPFTPHLTLARVKSGERQVGRALADLGLMARAWPLAVLAVRTIALMESQLRADGAVHRRLRLITLGAAS